MSYTTFEGINLWYDVQGSGPPLILIGGYALAHNQFENCNPLLREHFTTVHWNYRGQGQSDWTMTEAYRLEQWVDDMAAVLDAAKIEKAYIWATSTGAAIGIRFAGKYPERTLGLVAYPWVRADHTWRRIQQVSGDVADTFGIRAMARMLIGVVLSPEMLNSPEGQAYENWACPFYEANVNPTTVQYVTDAYSKVDLTGEVKKLKCPVLLLMGDDSALNANKNLDSASFNTLVREFRALKPNAEIAAISGAGSTYCVITKPRECVDAVVRFIGGGGDRGVRAA